MARYTAYFADVAILTALPFVVGWLGDQLLQRLR
jgi:hypothetical protein